MGCVVTSPMCPSLSQGMSSSSSRKDSKGVEGMLIKTSVPKKLVSK